MKMDFTGKNKESCITLVLLDVTDSKIHHLLATVESGGFLAHLASAFALVDDFQCVLPARGVLHAFTHHRKVAVAQHASHLVAL